MLVYELEHTVNENLLGGQGLGHLWADFLACLLTAFDLHALTVLDDVVDAQLEIFQTEGLGEEFVSASLECLLLVFLICLGRKQNDRQVVVVGVALDRTREFESIHLRHHNVGDNQVECLGLDDLQCLSTILRNVDSVVGLQQLLHEHQQLEVVLDNQQFVVVVIIGVVVCIGIDIWNDALEVDNGILGDVEVDFMLFVDLLGLEGFFVDG